MQRYLTPISICALALVFCLPSHAQDSPSLGDVARQAQKDKAGKPTAKVFTNDDMPSVASSIPSSPGAGSGRVAQPGPAGSPGGVQSPEEGLQRLQGALDHLASLDRASLATDVLEGNDSSFPGRDKWEEKLFAAKEKFVAQTSAILQKAKQITASSSGIKDAQDPNDSRVKSLAAKLDQLVKETQQDSAAFQAVVTEGKTLAAQSGAH
jgi:hypothetical protein